MNKALFFSIIAGCLMLLCGQISSAQSSRKYWVYLKDKGPSLPLGGSLSKNSIAYNKALTQVTTAALTRRAKVLQAETLVDASDLPIYQPYLDQLRTTGAIAQQQSRWMNATSFLATPDQLAVISSFSFVKKISPVVVLHFKNSEQNTLQRLGQLSKTASLDYGPSATQLQVINVPSLHDLGITGHNVIVGMLDTGFRWRAHESLQSRHVIGEHDFIQDDDTTANQSGDGSTQDQHGTLTMSTLGGYKPGQLIGPAFDAGFVLAKTEYVPVTDYKWEEDNWVAGIEWEESLGADVVSSSVGYNTFVDSTSYTWQNGDFDGRTTVSSLAAVRAARLGVVVCNAMGNELNGDGVTGTMLTPADADSIISVGAVNFSGLLAGFSSTGPTNDGRIKPDIVAPGVSVHCASTSGFSSYFNTSGTSLSTPLTGGVAALMLSARPELTPIQVRDALRNTASPITDSTRFPSSPNNFTGWGFINAFNAALSFGPIFSDEPIINIIDSTSSVSIYVASKFGIKPSTVLFHYAIGNSVVFDSIPMTLDTSMFFATSGRYSVPVPSQAIGTLVRFYIDAADSGLYSYQSPPAIINKLWQLNYGTTDVQNAPLLPQGFALLQNYPNPFNPSTRISYDLPRREHVRIQVFNVLGQIVATLVDEIQDAGNASSRPPAIFDAANHPSGVYFYRITTPSFTSTKKMMLIR
jgi:serine protease AprX